MESKLPILLLLIIFSCHSHISKAAGETPPTPSPEQIKAVNLGGWLVVEGWMKPSLFDEIPVNKDLLDGTQIQLKSVTLNKFLAAEDGGGSIIVANRSSASLSKLQIHHTQGHATNLDLKNPAGNAASTCLL